MKNKYYISVDLEGVACAVGAYGKGMSADNPNYRFAAEQATKEANAAAKALFDSGASDVIIWDSHGTGVNLDYYALDKRCSIALGSGSRKRFPGIDDSFEGVLFIGAHAFDSENATLAHTYSSNTFTQIKINGCPVGEIQIDAAAAGKYSVKTMFVSADDVCVKQAAETFPWAETVETKKALSWNSSISKHPLKVCDEIYESVCRAVKNSDKMKPYTINMPCELTLSYKRIEYAEGCTLRNPDNTPFAFENAYTRKGIINDIEDMF